MSALTYTKRPRLGPGWTRLAFAVAALTLVAASIWFGARIIGTLGQAPGKAPETIEERLVRDAYEAVKQSPKSALAHWQLSLALSTIGDYQRALTEAENSVRLDPKAVEPYYVLGVAYRGLKDTARAEKAFAKAAATPGAFGDVYREVFFDLGQVRMELKDYKGAVKAFTDALDNGPEATYVALALADAAHKAGDDKLAKEEYLAVLGYDPENKEAEKALKSMGVSEDEIAAARNPIAHQTTNEK